MSDYVPNTMVKVLKDVPLDNTYTDTRWFSSLGEQISFFSGKAKYSFSNMSYQRVNNGIANPRVALTCRVPTLADNIYDCNYIMFQNNNFGSKWFYAFIKQVNYINPNNTEIVYEIDYLQTFMFELDIKASFVEREHASAAEDVEFANLVPEPVGVSKWTEDIGSSESISFSDITGSNTSYIVIGFMPSDALSSAISGTGFMIDGIYSGCYYAICTSAGEANRFLLAVGSLGMSDHIVGVWMTRIRPTSGDKARQKTITTKLNPKRLRFMTGTGIYTVRNKKLISSQFCYFHGFSTTGDSKDWIPELFATDYITCIAEYSGVRDTQVILTPYYEASAGISTTLDQSLTFNQAVSCTWSSYGWINDGLVNIAQTLASAYMGSGLAGIGGATVETGMGEVISSQSVVSSGSSALATVSNSPTYRYAGSNAGNVEVPYTITDNHVQQNNASLTDFASLFPASKPQSGNVAAPTNILFSAEYAPFVIKRMCPTSQELERLDTFFDMFGYAVNKVKVPNLDTRAAWNYVKLKKPCIYGSVPVEGMSIIKNAFANGIRLWHVDAVGDYSIENPPK